MARGSTLASQSPTYRCTSSICSTRPTTHAWASSPGLARIVEARLPSPERDERAHLFASGTGMPTEDRRTHVAAEEIRDLLLIPSEVDKVSPSELTAEPIATVCVCVCVCVFRVERTTSWTSYVREFRHEAISKNTDVLQDAR